MQQGFSSFAGDVQIRQGARALRADEVRYQRQQQLVQASGAIRYRDDGLEATATHAEFNLLTDSGQLDQASYLFAPRHARGEAAQARVETAQVLELHEATYTTCDPGNDDWLLRASQVRLDRTSGRGTAKHVSVDFKGVPIFYWPYLRFPIDDRRQSGFLTPTFASSNRVGLALSAPYYLNLAPNYDATITPRLLSKRGIQLQNEFRYLTESHVGAVNLELLPHDRAFGDSRTLFTLRDQGVLAPGWTSEVDFSYASDEQYFSDLGNSLSLASITHLERRADIRYTGDDWSLLGRLQGFQTMDPNIALVDRPYQRLPQLLFRGELPDSSYGLRYRVRGEYVYFYRNDSVVGSRVDLEPGVSLPLNYRAGYLTPSLHLRQTSYLLGNTDPGANERPSRTLPVFSLDGGLFFERPLAWRGEAYTQTLEPRVYYLYVPYQNQDDIPIFDSAALDFSFSQLFRDNRFSGSDRVADANQITLALTSRLLEQDSGDERLRASAGQIFYFRDQLVTLNPSGLGGRNDSSDLVGELDYRLSPAWYARAAAQWNVDHQQTRRSTVQFHYQPDRKHIVNLGYRLRDDIDIPLEQTDVSFLWPLGTGWSIVGRWNYSLEDSLNLDSFLGFEYNSCCWALRVVARDYISGTTGDNNTGVYMQFELKGLTQLGDTVGGLLERGILGYSVDPDQQPL